MNLHKDVGVSTTLVWKLWQLNSGGAPQHYPSSPNSTVSAVETFRFQGSTVSQNLKRHTVLTESPKRPSRGCTSCCSSKSSTCLRSCWSVYALLVHHCMVWIRRQTGQEQTTMDSEVCKIWTNPESLLTHRTLDTTCSHSSPLGGATEHCTSKQADICTVSFQRTSFW